MEKKNKHKRILIGIYHYLIFFLLVAFIVSCSTMLFVTLLTRSMNLTLTDENISLAARLTFLNVLFISLLFTLVDLVRRRIMVDMPVSRIRDGIRSVMTGDFSVRIEKPRFSLGTDRFDEIIDGFNKMAEELSGMESLGSDFIAGVSHELKTPLSVMQNYATLLSAPGIDEGSRQEYSREIMRACKRLSGLITNILKLNKLENQSLPVKRGCYDLSSQLEECLVSFEDVWERKSMEIETSIPVGVMVRADAELAELVWNNLLSNAFKFTDDGGKVSLSLSINESFAEVAVSDNGIGISPEEGRRIFDKFYQADSSRATEGNGLGLSLVRRIIDLVAGEISVESEVGVGSKFTVRLPLAE